MTLGKEQSKAIYGSFYKRTYFDLYPRKNSQGKKHNIVSSKALIHILISCCIHECSAGILIRLHIYFKILDLVNIFASKIRYS